MFNYFYLELKKIVEPIFEEVIKSEENPISMSKYKGTPLGTKKTIFKKPKSPKFINSFVLSEGL